MMYLILPTEQAEVRNIQEATNRGCNGVTTKWWSEITAEDETALNVGNGEGLTAKELSQCIFELPSKFTINDIL